MRNSDQVNVDGKKYILEQDGTLVIPQVTINDIGEYECIAESKMGAEISRKARAVITVSPAIRFTQVILFIYLNIYLKYFSFHES